MEINEHTAEWHRWTLVCALRYNPDVGKLIDLDSIEEMIDDLIAQVKAEAAEQCAARKENTAA